METRVTLRTQFLSFVLPILFVCFPGTRAAFYSGNKPVDTMLLNATWNPTPSDILRKTILSGYDKFSRPENYDSITNVIMGMSVYHVALDDTSGLIELHSWVRLAWTDKKLKWNPSDFGSVESLHLAYHEIWQPDVVQHNSVAHNINQLDHTPCTVWSNGAVLWVTLARLGAFCDLELKRWPRDVQTCNFTFGAWTNDGTELSLANEPQIDGETFKASVYVENEEWELVDLKSIHIAKLPCCDDPYYMVIFEVTLQRRGTGRARVLRVLAAAAVLMALLGHLLPASTDAAAPRAVLAAAPLSLLALILFYLNENLPTTASRTSIDIVSLYTGSLCVSLCSALLSALAVVLSRRGDLSGGEGRAPPDLLRRAMASKYTRFLGALDNTSADGGKGWRSIASLLDRLSALLLSALFILLMLMVIYR